MLRFIIIGGGIGGLAAAIALRQAGVDAVVFERAAELREVGAALTVWANGVHALHQLRLGDALFGAEGLHSLVKARLFPTAAPRYAGYVTWRGIAPPPRAMADLYPGETWGGGSRFGIVPVRDGRVYWFATANLPAGGKDVP